MIEDQCWVKAWVNNRKPDVKSPDMGLRGRTMANAVFFFVVVYLFVSDRNEINTIMEIFRAKNKPRAERNPGVGVSVFWLLFEF